MKLGLILLGLCFLEPASLAAFASDGDRFPRPPYPRDPWHHHQQGTVWASITFARDGNVRGCTVQRSTADSSLNSATCSFVSGHWRSASLAGSTKVIPVTYVIVPGPVHMSAPANAPGGSEEHHGPSAATDDTPAALAAVAGQGRGIVVRAPDYAELMRAMHAQ